MMNRRQTRNIIIALVLVNAILASLFGWLVIRTLNEPPPKDARRSTKTIQPISSSPENAECQSADKDLCKAFETWLSATNYVITATSRVAYASVTLTTRVDNGGNYEVEMNSVYSGVFTTAYLGTDVYTQGGPAGVSWRAKPSQQLTENIYASDSFPILDPADITSYTKVGTEACGTRTCLKYQRTGPAAAPSVSTAVIQYLWFDHADLRLRQLEQHSNLMTALTIEYSPVTIIAPPLATTIAPAEVVAFDGGGQLQVISGTGLRSQETGSIKAETDARGAAISQQYKRSQAARQ
jgi:hypothetical protein